MSVRHGGQLGKRHRLRAALRRCLWAALTAPLVGCVTPEARFVTAPVSPAPITTPAPAVTRTATPPASAQPAVVRSQNPADYTPGNDNYFRQPMPPSGQPGNPWAPNQSPATNHGWSGNPPTSAPAANWNQTPTQRTDPAALWNNSASSAAPPQWNGTPSTGFAPPSYPSTQTVPAQWTSPTPTTPQLWGPGTAPPQGAAAAPGMVAPQGVLPPPGVGVVPGPGVAPSATLAPPVYGPPGPVGAPPGGVMGVPSPLTDIIVNVAEAQTGRLLIGAAVNSNAGLTGQIVLDEKNFDWRRFPRSWDDLPNAFRGGGQGFRIEALPGSEVQRYMVQFTEPYFLDTRVSFNVSGFLFDRSYFDWDENRLGGRIGFGYRVTPDLSVQLSSRLERVRIDDPRVPNVPQLESVLGDNELYSVRLGITNDTRDIPFAPTQGSYIDLSFEHVMGTFDYSRGTVDFRRYFLVTERPDGSGRHVLGFSSRASVSGSQTPIYDNFFAGGYTTLRGFDFRGASPVVSDVRVGGRLMLLGSVEYRLPITADDALQGVVFCDYGTVEEDINIDYDNYRVAFGAGVRVAIPALSAAPIALDFAIPVARADTDDIQNFAFFVGVAR